MQLDAESGLLVGGVLEARAAPSDWSAGRLLRRLRRWWRQQVTTRAEDEVIEAAWGGQSIRLVAPLVSPVLLVPAAVVLREPDNTIALVALVYGAVAIGYGALAAKVQQRLGNPFWMQLASAVVYAAIISLVVWTFLVVDHPRVHAHWIVFFLYFLLIGATGMADEPRLCVCAGGLSIVGYLVVAMLAQHAAETGSSAMAMRLASELEWVANSAKVALLAGATVTATASAARGRALRRTSLRDGLTGLLNRHAFDRCLELVARRARRSGRTLSIAMIDIDHFKVLNDTHGHALGDAVLRWVSAWLRRSVRVTDVVARYGGEEFVVAFLDTDDIRLRERLEALRLGLERTQLRPPEAATDLEIRVSMGIAHLPADGDDVTQVLAQADERLYQAKRGGRNRIVDAPRPDAEGAAAG